MPGQLSEGALCHHVSLMSLAVSLVLLVSRPCSSSHLPMCHRWSLLYLKVSWASCQHPHKSSIVRLHVCVRSQWCSNISKRENKKQHLLLCRGCTGTKTNLMMVTDTLRVNGGRGQTPSPPSFLWSGFAAKPFDEKLPDPSVRQHFMRFAKKHC